MNDQSSNGSLAPMDDNKSLTHRERVKEYYKEMRESCKIAVDMTADYLQNIEKHRPFPTVKPGFLLNQIPSDPPENGVAMTTIFKDVDELLLPGVTHWNHPNFHAYFAMANSYPALCADIVASGIGGIGFTWASSPVSTELEVIMMNWLVKMLGLPDFYLHHNCGGGGVIGTTCSEQAIVTMMAARNRAVDSYMTKHPEANKFEVLAKLVSYASSEAHCSVERAGLLNLLPIKKLKVDDKFQLTGATVEEAIREDIAKGLIPYYCVVTLGTTGCCSFDRLEEIGPICQKYGIWVHVDAAYAGSALICPEFRRYMKGIEYTDSFAFNPHKWLLTNFDCSVVWYRNSKSVTSSFSTDAQYLKYDELEKMPDYRTLTWEEDFDVNCNWQLSFGRRFRSLKLWFVIRKFGTKGLQEYIRGHVRMAKYLETLIVSDRRFELISEVVLGLVCFRIRNNNELTRELHKRIEEDGRIHLVTSKITHPETQEEIFFIRIAIVYIFTDEKICNFAFKVISEVADQLLDDQKRLSNGNGGRVNGHSD